MKKELLAILSAFIMVALPSCEDSSKELGKMEDLYEFLDKNADSMSDKQWQSAIEKYRNITEKMAEYDYSTEDLEMVGRLHAKISGIFFIKASAKVGSYLKGFLGEAADEFEDYMDSGQLDSLFSDFDESLDELMPE